MRGAAGGDEHRDLLAAQGGAENPGGEVAQLAAGGLDGHPAIELDGDRQHDGERRPGG